MPSYVQYKKMMAVLDEDSDIESWITVKGNHIPIRKGQTKEEAVKSFVEKKQGKSGSGEGSASHGKGDYTIAHKDKSGNTTVIAEVSHHTIGGEKKATKKATALKHHKDLDSMLESVMAYGGHKMSPEDILSSDYHGKYLKDYVTKYGEEDVKEAIKDMQSKIDHIEHDVYTDSEGGSYNSIVWKKDTATAPKSSEKGMVPDLTIQNEELNKLRSSFGDHYDKLYNSQYLDDKYNYLLGEWDKRIKDPEFKKQVQTFVKAFGDYLTSDREVKAYMLALQDQEKAAQAPKERKIRSSKKEPAIVRQNGVNWVDAKAWNDPRSDPWYALYE